MEKPINFLFFGHFFFKVLPCIIVKKVYKKDKKKKSVRGMIQLLSKGMIFVALFLATIFFVCSKSYLGETFLKYFPDVNFFFNMTSNYRKVF